MKVPVGIVDRRGHAGSSRALRALLIRLSITLGTLFLLASCTVIQPQGAPVVPVQTVSHAAMSPAGPGSGAPATGKTAQINIYTPATTTSVPVILASRELAQDASTGEMVRLTVFSNHSQANTLFLRGDVDILVTGLSVGLGLFKNGAPIQVINCNVSGLTYLVTYGRPVNSLAELKGDSLYVPFEGSPIEETSRFFVEREGLAWNKDIKPVYSPSDSALALLKQGKALAVALPEPFVTLAAQDPQVRIDFAYRDKWNVLTGSTNGYPQVCAFAKKTWIDDHKEAIAHFNKQLASAIQAVQRDSAAAAEQTKVELTLPSDVLLSGLRRTEFDLLESGDMTEAIRHYYQTVGKPLDASYDPFFYTG